MYRLICSEPVTLNTDGVQVCSDPAGWIVQQIPEPFSITDLESIDLTGYFLLGFLIYFAYFVISTPLKYGVNSVVELIKQIIR